MNWWATLIGAALGFFIGGPIGALVGALLANLLGGSGHRGPWVVHAADAARIQTVFFTTAFSVMGCVAKADGRVSPDEIRAAEAVMARMNLRAEQRQAAIHLFNEGKRQDFPLKETLRRFRQECGPRTDLFLAFVEIQLHAALIDGRIDPAERAVLDAICRELGIGAAAFQRLETLIRAQYRSAADTPGGRPDGLAQAYSALGVNSNASDADVKKAYRRLMNQHHPDKLVARGVPEEMIRLAQERTRQINVAYERVKEARGIR